MADARELFRVLKDSNGDGDAPDLREEGQAEGDAVSQAILPVKDESGNLQYIPMVGGQISVTSDVPGTIVEDDQITAAVKGADTTGASLTLTTTEIYDNIEVITSSFKPVQWSLKQLDDATTTVLATWLTGAGSFSFNKIFEHKQVTAGASGTQTLFITGNQLTGSGNNSDMHTYIAAIEKA